MAIFTVMAPRKSLSIHYEDVLFILVLLIGAILRFYNYAEFTITNDELAGIVLSTAKTPGELYQLAASDVHPLGYTFLLHYWVSAFGDSVTSLRLPFILFGLGSVVLVYLIGCRWFGRFTALMASTCFALLTFTVLYSQLARPYSPGLFFSLLTIWCWTHIVFPERRSKINVRAFIGFVVAGWASLMLHYFAFLVVVVAGFTGLVFVRGIRLRYYLLCGVAIIALYVPFIPIFLAHLKSSGLDWMGKPDSSFLLTFLQTVFNNDFLLLYVFIIGISILAWEARKRLRWTIFHSISLLFFVLPFAIAYAKSVLGKPVLQDRALLFQLPYLILFICSFNMPNYKDIRQSALRYGVWGIFTIVALYSFIFRVNYFHDGYKDFGNFKAAFLNVKKHYQEYPNQITWVADVNRPFYSQYYADALKNNSYTIQSSMNIRYALTRCDNEQGMDSLIKIVDHTNTPYFYFWWCHSHYMPAVNGVIRQKYPVIVDDVQEPRHGMTFFAKDIAWGDTVFYSKNTMDTVPADGWNNGNAYSSTAYSGQQSSFMKGTVYGPSFSKTVQATGLKKGDRVMVKAQMRGAVDEKHPAKLVMEVTGSHQLWNGLALSQYHINPLGWTTIYFLNTLENDVAPGDELKTYFYNTGGDVLYIDDMEVIAYRKK